MITQLVTWLVTLVAPKAPKWAVLLLAEVIPAAIDIVEALKTTDLEGADKFELAAEEVEQALDEAFDTLPKWSEISEERRDLIISGLVELTVFLAVDAGGLGTPRKTRRYVRKLMRQAVVASKEA